MRIFVQNVHVQKSLFCAELTNLNYLRRGT